MTEFKFCEEMVYGKKHLSKLQFNCDKYNMFKDIEELFGYSKK